MTDHAQRIAEEARIREMECRVKPLIILLSICIILVLADSLLETYAAYKYQGQIKTAKAFASALNGAVVDTGESIITCQIKKTELVQGIK
jgi:hypothetical protein